jgi:predicted CoA-binding protein
MTQTVVVLGASPKSNRYSNKAIRMLKEQGYDVIPVHPKIEVIEGLGVVSELGLIKQKVDTLTLYVGPERSKTMLDSIVSLHPGRVIFNPGTESQLLESHLDQHKIPYIKGCTLVMLETGTFW